MAAGGCCSLAVLVPCFAWSSLRDVPGDRSCLLHGCRTLLVPGSARPRGERMLPAPPVWLMPHHLLWRVRQGEWQAFEEPINPACEGFSWR